MKTGDLPLDAPTDRRTIHRHRTEILSALVPWRTISRGALSRATGLSAATVSRITRGLVRTKILNDVALPHSTVGRPTRGLEVNGTGGTVLGVSLLMPSAQLVLLDLRGQILRRVSQPLQPHLGPAGILGPLEASVRGILGDWPADLAPVRAVGLAVPGQWQRGDGVSVTYPRMPEWRNIPIQQLVQDWSGCTTLLVGHAPAVAVAESAHCGDAEPKNLLCVEVGDQIAMGIVVNGQVVEGASGNAGELGHITVDPRGPMCYCGNHGCLETLATCGAVEDEIRNSEAAKDVFVDAGSVTFAGVVDLARRGDSFSVRLLSRSARTLGMGLATALNLLNPELLVLSGPFFEAGDLVMGPLRASIADHALANTTRNLTIEQSKVAAGTSATGAGLLVIKDIVTRL